MNNCPHTTWLTGDGYIARTHPGFFDEHERAPSGFEWQTCASCGLAKQVRTEPTLQQKLSAATVLPRRNDYNDYRPLPGYADMNLRRRRDK